MLDNINEEVVKLGYCRNVIKENNRKTYIFDDNQSISIESYYELCSELIDGKVIIGKRDLYGVGILCSDEIINELNLSPEEAKNTYIRIEPKYKKVHIGVDYIYTLDDENVYTFDFCGRLIKKIEKRSDFQIITDNVIYNEEKLYEINKKSVTYSWVKEKKPKKENGYRYFITTNGKTEMIYDPKYPRNQDINYIYRFSKYGEKVSTPLNIDRYMDIGATSDKDIIFVYLKNDEYGRNTENGFVSKSINGFIFINITNGAVSEFYEKVSDFVNGHAIVSAPFTQDSIYPCSINKNFEKKEIIGCSLSEGKLLKDDYDSEHKKAYSYDLCERNNEYSLDYGYAPVGFYNSTGIVGYINTKGEIVIPRVHLTYSLAKRALKKYIKKNGDKIESDIVESESDKIYNLERKIRDYLVRINIPKLHTKFNLIQNRYKNMIQDSQDKEVENRKNLILRDMLPTLSIETYYVDSDKGYKEKLRQIIKMIEDNYFIIEILETLNTITNILNGEKVEKINSLVTDSSKLYELYSELNEKEKEEQIKKFKEKVQECKKYVEDYIFEINKDFKYTSFETWKEDFKLELFKLIVVFREEYYTKQVKDRLICYKESKNALKENRYRNVLKWFDEYNAVIKRIEETGDIDIIKGLEKYKRLDINYNDNLGTVINSMARSLIDIYSYEIGVKHILEPKVKKQKKKPN